MKLLSLVRDVPAAILAALLWVCMAIVVACMAVGFLLHLIIFRSLPYVMCLGVAIFLLGLVMKLGAGVALRDAIQEKPVVRDTLWWVLIGVY